MKYTALFISILATALLGACGQSEPDRVSAEAAPEAPGDAAVAAVAALPDGMIRQASNVAPGQAIRSLVVALRGAGLTVFARVDHAANAERAELAMPDSQVIIFGNPKVGTPLMVERPEVALDLPMKMLAYTDADGQHWVAYQDPTVLADRYAVSPEHPSIQTMVAAMARFAAIAAGESPMQPPADQADSPNS